jgi:hypothetical protein
MNSSATNPICKDLEGHPGDGTSPPRMHSQASCLRPGPHLKVTA